MSFSILKYPRLALPAVLLILLSGAAGPLGAQDTGPNTAAPAYTFIFKGEPLQHALQRLVKKTDLDLIYDPSIMTEHSVYATARKRQPEEVLRIILAGSGLDFIQLSSGTYVLTAVPKKKTLRGNLTGRVVDKHTGQPLAGANVMLADASGGAATTGSGRFVIPRLETGYHEITINYVGYRPVRDTVWVPANASTSLNFTMTSQPVAVEPIVVDGIQKRRPASQPLISGLSPSQITSSQPSGTADAVKSLDAVTGISFSLPLADFNIQGGSSSDHQLRLDGVPVYNPVSMGRMMGAFSPWAIQKIQISKAGFGAGVGSQLSGVINMVQDVGNTDDRRFMLQANSLNINGRLDQQFDIKEGPAIKLMLAGRTNIWQWYQNAALKRNFRNWDRLDPLLTLHLIREDSSDTIFQPRDHSYNINYYDLHATARIEHNPFHRTSISAYYGKNALETGLFSEDITLDANFSADLFYSSDRYDWQNTMAKIEHEWVAGSRLDATLSAYYTRHTFDHSYLFTDNHRANLYNSSFSLAQSGLKNHAQSTMATGDQNAMIQSSARLNLNYTASKNYNISGGLRVTHLDYRFRLSDQYYNAARSNGRSFLVSGYLQNHFLLSPKASLSAGNRFTFVPSRDLVFAEPRLSIKYDEPDTQLGYLSTRISGGIYRQFINRFDVSSVGPSSLVPSLRFWVPIDYTTTVPKAYHLALDALWEPSDSWKIELESYYKWIPSRLMLDYRALSGFTILNKPAYSEQEQFITSARGYSYGAGISFNKRIAQTGMELQGGYQFSIARQRFPSRFGDQYQPLPANQPHRADASLNWSIVSDLKLLLQWQGIWGRSWGFRKAYYDYLSIRERRNYGSYSFLNPEDNRLPLYSQLNAGASYRLDIGEAALQVRFDVFNLLDRHNVLDWWLDPQRTETGDLSYSLQKRTMSGIRPSLSIKLSY